MKFDLHMHSSYSKDGEKSPAELIDLAKQRHLEVIALCDHDCVKGVKEMIELGKKENILVIPAIECSTLFDGYNCHLLGYGIDLEYEYFHQLGDRIQKLGEGFFHRRFEKFTKKYGIDINEEELIREANGGNCWALLCDKVFHDPKYQQIEDFKDYIPGGKRCDPAPVNFYWDKCQKGSDLHVRIEYPSMEETIRHIHQAGGIAVLAHPYRIFYHQEKLLKKAIEAGIDGIEAYSNYHDPAQCIYYRDYAQAHHLLISCGSDYHGKLKPSIQMGEYGLKEDGTAYLEAILNCMKKAKY